MGKRKGKRNLIEEQDNGWLDQDGDQAETDAHDPTCALCLRSIPSHTPQSLHHLIPKLKGGRGGPTVLLHDLCHKEIHATLREAELARVYNTMDALRSQPHLEKFIAWLSKKPPDFNAPTLKSERRRKR
ncbi:MAG: HNH endonuclease [Pseudomonadota bacterium]